MVTRWKMQRQKSERPKSETTQVATRITKGMLIEVDKIVLCGHLNMSDYLRDLIRKDLEERRRLDVLGRHIQQEEASEKLWLRIGRRRNASRKPLP